MVVPSPRLRSYLRCSRSTLPSDLLPLAVLDFPLDGSLFQRACLRGLSLFAAFSFLPWLVISSIPQTPHSTRSACRRRVAPRPRPVPPILPRRADRIATLA